VSFKEYCGRVLLVSHDQLGQARVGLGLPFAGLGNGGDAR
jgi:hypothetical protein